MPPSPLLLSSGSGLPEACPPSPPPLVARATYCPLNCPCSGPWQRSDGTDRACAPTHSSTGVCVHRGVLMVSPGQPPHRALTWVPVCCEGRPVTPLLGSCDPGFSVSAASVAFPRKGDWAEVMSSASLFPEVAQSGGWSSGAALLASSSGSAVAGHPVSSLHARGPLSVLAGVFSPV